MAGQGGREGREIRIGKKERESKRIRLIHYIWTKGSKQDQWIQVTKKQGLVQCKELDPNSYKLSRNGKVMSFSSLKHVPVEAESFFVRNVMAEVSVVGN